MFKNYVTIFLLSLLILVPLSQVGADSNINSEISKTGFTPQTSYLATSIDSTKYLAKAFFYILLIFALVFLATRFFLAKGLPVLGSEHFRIIQRLPLEVQAALYLVQLGEKYFLLGVGGKQISFLNEVTKGDIEMLLQKETSKPSFLPFQAHLSKFLKDKRQ
ncbi:MAG: flagellar biosynthetic protein FliO [Candidatus Margulisbacteria bacterium]|nr:flagellar biosynthetic protein FliO [Candidatus Margulisiibacteriota bacterium]